MTQIQKRTALIFAAAGVLSACASVPPPNVEAPQPNFPVRRPAEAAPAPAAEAPPPQARPTTSVETTALPPPAPAAPPPVRTEAPPPAVYQPLPRPVQPTYQTVTRTSVSGRVVDAEGPGQTRTVSSGDTLYSIARKFDMTPKALAALNGLKAPYTIRPGQKLKGPGSKGKAYVVSSGDTLFAIGRRFGVSAQAIADSNDIALDTGLKVGQRLLLPEGYKDRGPLQVTTQVAIAPPPQPSVQQAPPPAPRPQPPVQQMPPPVAQAPAPRPQPPAPQTPPPVVQRPAPMPAAVAPQPSTRPLPPPAQATLPPPRPQPQAQPQPPSSAVTASQVPPSRPPVPQTPPPVAQRPAAPTIIPSAGPLTDAQISQLGRGRFLWPVRGDLISDFGPKGTGQRNDGINIRSTAGEPVRAAAAGEVVYAGDQVPGFGNLVLIKHADGWVTAYGHLGRVDVKMQERISQGQQIGQAGASGGMPETQLHFEVRYAPTPADRARPINPMLVLPR